MARLAKTGAVPFLRHRAGPQGTCQREGLTGILARPGLANAERRLGGTEDRRPATTAEAVPKLVLAERLADQQGDG